MKILLVNPPADRYYLRDYFCSTVSKSGYYWHPIDLLVQSGFLSKNFEVAVIDAIVEKISEEETYKKILFEKPDAILSLTSTLTFNADMNFLKKIKLAIPSCIIFVVGEPFLENPAELLNKYDFISAALLNFINDDITSFLEKKYDDLKTIVYRKGDNVIMKNIHEKRGNFTYPIPRHELFPLKKYWMPFILHHPFASVLTTYGCPYNCSFCNSGINSLGFSVRDTQEVIEEIKYTKSLGIKHIFFKDMTFGAPKDHALKLCEELIRQNIKISWHCYSRADSLDNEMLTLMKKAGCNLIQIGVETSNAKLLSNYNKHIPLEITKKTFELARKLDIQIGAHFILGLPGENMQDIIETIKLAKALNPCYASFNIAFPRKGAQFNYIFDNTTINSSMCQVVNKANISFYLRPSYLLRLIRNIQTLTQFRSVIREWKVVLNSFYNLFGN